MSPIHIRPAVEFDLPKIQKLCCDLAHSDYMSDTDVDLKWAYTPDGEKYLKEKIDGTKGSCFVAEVNGEIVGYVAVSLKELPSWRLVKVAELENIYVNEKERSRGVGRLLVEAFLKWASEQKAERASVCVFSPNEKAIGFYKKIGFSPYDMTMEMNIQK